MSGVKLNDHILKYICEPLGVKDVTMFPSAEMKANLAHVQQRWPGSTKAEERDHPYAVPLLIKNDDDKQRVLNSGGAGCFAKPAEYVKILAALLNDGKSVKTGKSILKPETVKEMFKNQIPQFPDYARQGIPISKFELANEAPEVCPLSNMSICMLLFRGRSLVLTQCHSCIRKKAIRLKAGAFLS